MREAKKYPPLTEHQQRLVEANLGIARLVAHQLRRKGGLYARCDIDILTSAAYEGLCDAAPRFDPSRGVKFGTYATYYCVRHCQLAASASGAVTLPRMLVGGGASEQVRAKASRVTHPVRLDMRDADDHASCQAVSREADPAEAATLREAVGSILSRLMPREREAILAHYVEGRKMDDIGADMGITRARVQQIAALGLARLRGEPTKRTEQSRKRKKGGPS